MTLYKVQSNPANIWFVLVDDSPKGYGFVYLGESPRHPIYKFAKGEWSLEGIFDVEGYFDLGFQYFTVTKSCALEFLIHTGKRLPDLQQIRQR